MGKANITDTSKAATSNTHSVKPKPIYDFVKRVFDIVCSLIGLIVLSPVFIILSILIKTTSEGPAFFAHKRVGKGGKTIKIYKFRSMVTNAEELIKQFTPEQKAEYEKNFKLENDPRVTKVGKFMRKTSLDELPQLWNILKGDMSFVGPRPLISSEMRAHRLRLEYGVYRFRPGLTGLAQINGRDEISLMKKMKYDKIYCDNWSIKLDLIILLKSVGVALKQEGYQEGKWHRR